MDLTQINLMAVLVAALSNFVIGALWYSSLLFQKPWMRESGMVFDKLVLTTDPNLVPAGSGPGESAQGGNPLPVLDPIGDRSVNEGSTLNFTVTASDPDATTPVLGATNLPAGASFTDNLDGSGTFSWATASGDAGTYLPIMGCPL